MRITADAKTATRMRILQAATGLLSRDGWQNATTRAIALEAGIAVGTLFNYFATKEAVAATLITDSLDSAGAAFRAGRREDDSLEADLFLMIWSGLRSLHEYRNFLGPAAETIFSRLARKNADSPGDAIREKHLELVQSILASHGFPSALPAVTGQLYWTLYMGVFDYWAADDSPEQQDSLELLDRSLKLFVASLRIGRQQ
jgi:AcrR family transcriptional regulator